MPTVLSCNSSKLCYNKCVTILKVSLCSAIRGTTFLSSGSDSPPTLVIAASLSRQEIVWGWQDRAYITGRGAPAALRHLPCHAVTHWSLDRRTSAVVVVSFLPVNSVS